MKIGYVYILESPNSKRFYIGSTIDCARRLAQHNRGKVVSTKGKGPWRIALQQTYEDISIARSIEYSIKRLKNRKIIEKMIAEGHIRLKP